MPKEVVSSFDWNIITLLESSKESQIFTKPHLT